MYIISVVIQLPGKIPKSDWLREVVFQLNKYFKFLMKSSLTYTYSCDMLKLDQFTLPIDMSNHMT